MGQWLPARLSPVPRLAGCFTFRISHHAIAPLVFRVIKGKVSGFDQLFHAAAATGPGCDACGNRDGWQFRLAVFDRDVAYLVAEFLRNLMRLRLIHIGAERDKLLPAKPTWGTPICKKLDHPRAQGPQHHVACIMAMVIVEGLEVININ